MVDGIAETQTQTFMELFIRKVYTVDFNQISKDFSIIELCIWAIDTVYSHGEILRYIKVPWPEPCDIHFIISI